MQEPTAPLESDPQFYKLNSVHGEVRANGAPVPGATVTVARTDETHRVEADGTYLLVLDPQEHGTRRHELIFRAPGHREQRHTVSIPENNQVTLKVILEPAEG